VNSGNNAISPFLVSKLGMATIDFNLLSSFMGRANVESCERPYGWLRIGERWRATSLNSDLGWSVLNLRVVQGAVKRLVAAY
jgi:hypothetical protein